MSKWQLNETAAKRIARKLAERMLDRGFRGWRDLMEAVREEDAGHARLFACEWMTWAAHNEPGLACSIGTDALREMLTQRENVRRLSHALECVFREADCPPWASREED